MFRPLESARPDSGFGPLGDAAPCGLLCLDAEYRILACNAYFAAMLDAADPQALIGTRFHGFLSVAGRIYLQTRLQQQLALAGCLEELALDIVTPRGRTPVMLNAAQETDIDGRPGTIRIAIWRAAARRAYEAEVPKAREVARVAVAAKQDFLANISHEIRTPLNGVIGLAGALGRTALQPRQREMVDLIIASGDVLVRLVSDILDISKVQAGKLALEERPFDLIASVQGVIDVGRLKADEKGLVFRLEVAQDLEGWRNGDAVRLRQILGNLLSNALKFTQAGEVSVALSVGADDAVLIKVQDTGIGFDESVGDTLFSRFGQADTSITRRFGGTGLGLSICKALAEAMGGSIRASSKPGVGSRFTVTLPLPRAEAEFSEIQALDIAAPGKGAERLRILLVEDNETNRRVVELILGEWDVDLVMAEHGAAGLEAWSHEAFDLVLMDAQMPVMDGLTAIREMRRRERANGCGRRTPIAMLSANATDEDRRAARVAGADLHIAKPITPVTLMAGINAVLAIKSAAA